MKIHLAVLSCYVGTDGQTNIGKQTGLLFSPEGAYKHLVVWYYRRNLYQVQKEMQNTVINV
jgi:hypothetical protein